ncbi:hypothetical protein BBJ29_003925 [Phytophthora kernoviae]|uniref:Uncharacterized protein n=1 Tax=Phytophthora kernoviae TaxID=325452 RepID=A0A3F2S2A2_9STRA|nr:hypothetical protein BBJ29_003925 [Phytophthora kernoviae]RLN68885.1 hypothetical protein BBP00_00000729 [Phytophthora kernoviae]
MAHDGSNLFQIRRIFGFPASPSAPNGPTKPLPALKIASMAVHTLDKKQLLALAICEELPKPSPKPGEASTSTSTPINQQAGRAERLSSLEFSPEGDWLAALSTRKNRLHLVPVLRLVARQRRAMLDASYQPTSHHRELMNVNQAAMTTQMASYLRATNEYGGLNGARYHSQVAGDDEQMSTLEFAPGIGTITCENAEECRCELVDAGTIESIDLLEENFRKEKRTSMLVKTKTDDIDEKEKEAGGTGVRYYRVVLEKKFQPRPKVSPRRGKAKQAEKEPPAAPSTLKIETASGESLSSKHFLEDMDFRPQRIKKNSPHVCLYAINGVLSSESSLALYDSKKQKTNLYSNFHWKLKGEYEIPDLMPTSPGGADHGKNEEASNRQQQEEKENEEDGDENEEVASDPEQEKDEVVDVDLTYCSTDLMLLQGRTSTSNETISTWVSLPSNQGMDDDVATAHIVHYLSLHGNEKIERVVQSAVRSQTSSNGSGAGGSVRGNQSSEAEIIYILQTEHHVYECRPQWSRLALFKALCAHSIALRDALSIGYALGIDMASLCQVVANTLYNSVIDGSTTVDEQLVQWMRDLFEVSRVIPSSAVEQLTAIGGVQSAIDYAQHVLVKPVRDSVYDVPERRRVALLLVDLVLQQQLQKDPSLDLQADEALFEQQQREDKREAWLVEFLETNQDYMTADIVDLCLSQQHVEKAILAATRRNEESDFQEQMREELLELLNSLVVQSHISEVISEQVRAAILARLLVKWFDYGLKRTVLEVFLIDPNVFTHVSPLLAQIFFSEVVASILGVELSVGSTTTSVNGGFDDRDKEWVLKCQQLPFSGQFLFRVCASFLEKDHVNPEVSDHVSSPTLKLLELIKKNVVENDLSHDVVPIAPHSAQALGKTDPLETHVKAFTCGHLFPKRVFEEEVVPEFEKRMNALPIPLFATKQAFAREFKRGASETPCPVCSFNKISQLVHQQHKRRQFVQHKQRVNGKARIAGEPLLQHQPITIHPPKKAPYYFLHREASERSGYSANAQNSKPQRHEEWEWREQRAS